MTELEQYMESGILEMYVMGHTSPEENLEVEEMAARHAIVKNAIEEISITLEQFATRHAVAPDLTIKPFLMATIDYMERLGSGEVASFPPELHTGSVIEDYREWLDRKDLELNEPLQVIHAKIIGYTPKMTTAFVWLELGAPPETHTDEFEKFLVLEGTCNIRIDGEDNHLKAGDVLIIPLFKEHSVQVTSACPCKILLQRVAA